MKLPVKYIFLSLLLLFTCSIIFGQTSFIQVNGEAGLSVLLNGGFKGKTTVEYKGLIIENLTPGKNVIKVVKAGFIPFEETINVRPGEVFAYNVQPFSKPLVTISEEGNTGETDKKAEVKTGNLVVQSVPIDITITMPKIEGIDKRPKTKDKWMVDKVPVGNYEITFSYGQKLITKTVEIQSDKLTSAFISMLSGEFSVKTEEKPLYQSREETITFINQFLSKQGKVTFETEVGLKKYAGKTEKETQSYDSHALKYNAESESYSINLNCNVLKWVLQNGDFIQYNSPYDYNQENISLKGKMTFDEYACKVVPLVSGSCKNLLIKLDNNGTKSTLSIALTGKDPNAIPLLQTAFLHLNELSSD